MKIKTIVNDCERRPATVADPKLNMKKLEYETTYIVKENGTKYVFVIPARFEFDGASIPRALWSVVGTPFEPDLERGALLHDYLYRENPENIGRKMADTIFYETIRADTVGYCRAKTIYAGVRSGGWYAWSKHRGE